MENYEINKEDYFKKKFFLKVVVLFFIINILIYFFLSYKVYINESEKFDNQKLVKDNYILSNKYIKLKEQNIFLKKKVENISKNLFKIESKILSFNNQTSNQQDLLSLKKEYFNLINENDNLKKEIADLEVKLK